MSVKKNIRRKSALKRLEAQREAFIAAGKDKESWTTHHANATRTTIRERVHAGRPYDKELERLNAEIKHLKELMR